MGRTKRHADRDVTALDPRIKGWLEATVTYLEMVTPPSRPPVAARHGVEVRCARRPTASFFRYLYDTIGDDWTWTGRRLMGDTALLAAIHDPLVEVNVLWVDGVPAGLAEINHRGPPDIELGLFGLIPDFVGRGLGGFFLNWAIDRAWSARPRRFWLHTCDLDHPNALPVYQKAGFAAYDRQGVREAILHGMPSPRRSGELVKELLPP